jgi:hypothetical protein
MDSGSRAIVNKNRVDELAESGSAEATAAAIRIGSKTLLHAQNHSAAA